MSNFFPKKCNCTEEPTNPIKRCDHEGLTTNDIAYSSNDLVCTGIEKGDSITTGLQMLEYYMCSDLFAQHFLDVLLNNTEDFPDFIDLVNGNINCSNLVNCITTNTSSTTTSTTTLPLTTSTTSSTSSTTTTSTTIDTSCIIIQLDVSVGCNGNPYAVLQFTDCYGNVTIELVSPGDSPSYCVRQFPPPVFLCGGAEEDIQIIGTCSTSSTSTSSTTTSTSTSSTTTTTTTLPLTTSTTSSTTSTTTLTTTLPPNFFINNNSTGGIITNIIAPSWAIIYYVPINAGDIMEGYQMGTNSSIQIEINSSSIGCLSIFKNAIFVQSVNINVLGVHTYTIPASTILSTDVITFIYNNGSC